MPPLTDAPVICELSLLDDPGTRGFALPLENGTLMEGFLVRRGDAVYAYVDRCPHTGVGLAWVPDRYLDADGVYIQCALHGALFLPESGYCVSGPCAGASLQSVPVEVSEGRIRLRAQPDQDSS